MADDRVWFEQLYLAHYDDVHRYCSRRIEPSRVGDTTAETFAVAWRRRSDLPRERALPWLYGVARRVLANDRRSQVRFARLTRTRAAGVGDGSDPEPTVVRRAEEAEVSEALGRLNDADREVIRLAAWEELSREDIGVALGCSPNTATKRLTRALDRLARELGVADRDRSTRMIGDRRPA